MTGCLDSYGNCRTVGERFYENCDTVECQIVNGSCYHLVTLSKGKEKKIIQSDLLKGARRSCFCCCCILLHPN